MWTTTYEQTTTATPAAVWGALEKLHSGTPLGPNSDEVGPELGPQISGDFPVAMAELLAAAENPAE